jgi:hypothetical protein
MAGTAFYPGFNAIVTASDIFSVGFEEIDRVTAESIVEIPRLHSDPWMDRLGKKWLF